MKKIMSILCFSVLLINSFTNVYAFESDIQANIVNVESASKVSENSERLARINKIYYVNTNSYVEYVRDTPLWTNKVYVEWVGGVSGSTAYLRVTNLSTGNVQYGSVSSASSRRVAQFDIKIGQKYTIEAYKSGSATQSVEINVYD